MGYRITQTGAEFVIPKESVDRALAAIKELVEDGRDYRWVSPRGVRTATDIEEAMAEWGFDIIANGANGDCSDISFLAEKSGDEEVLFKALAPYVTAGSYISFLGEDGSHWRWYFDGTSVRHQPGRIIYEDTTP